MKFQRVVFCFSMIFSCASFAAGKNYHCTVSRENKPYIFEDVIASKSFPKANSGWILLYQSKEVEVSFRTESRFVGSKLVGRVMSLISSVPGKELPEAQASAPEKTAVSLYDYNNSISASCD